MTKKHFVYFANYICELRRRAKECSNIEGESEQAMDCARECQNMAIEAGKKFNQNFDEARFVKACQPKS